MGITKAQANNPVINLNRLLGRTEYSDPTGFESLDLASFLGMDDLGAIESLLLKSGVDVPESSGEKFLEGIKKRVDRQEKTASKSISDLLSTFSVPQVEELRAADNPLARFGGPVAPEILDPNKVKVDKEWIDELTPTDEFIKQKVREQTTRETPRVVSLSDLDTPEKMKTFKNLITTKLAEINAMGKNVPKKVKLATLAEDLKKIGYLKAFQEWLAAGGKGASNKKVLETLKTKSGLSYTLEQ